MWLLVAGDREVRNGLRDRASSAAGLGQNSPWVSWWGAVQDRQRGEMGDGQKRGERGERGEGQDRERGERGEGQKPCNSLLSLLMSSCLEGLADTRRTERPGMWTSVWVFLIWCYFAMSDSVTVRSKDLKPLYDYRARPRITSAPFQVTELDRAYTIMISSLGRDKASNPPLTHLSACYTNSHR